MSSSSARRTVSFFVPTTTFERPQRIPARVPNGSHLEVHGFGLDRFIGAASHRRRSLDAIRAT
jgi:hypothetical protein